MGQPVLRLGSANEKLFPLVGAQSPTSTTYAPAAAAIPTAGGDQSVAPPAWMGVATHQTGMTAGSFTGGAGATNYTFGTAPVVLVGGLGADAGADASRVVRGLRTTEGGVLRVVPSGNWDASGNWRAAYFASCQPQTPPNNTTSHTALGAGLVGAGLRAYATQIVVTIGTATAVGTIRFYLEDASGGTVQWEVWLPIGTPAGMYVFPNILARTPVNGQFYMGMTTTAAVTAANGIAMAVHGYTSGDAN